MQPKQKVRANSDPKSENESENGIAIVGSVTGLHGKKINLVHQDGLVSRNQDSYNKLKTPDQKV